jgi:hypothetical protein
MVLGKEGLKRSICHGWQGRWFPNVGGKKEGKAMMVEWLGLLERAVYLLHLAAGGAEAWECVALCDLLLTR